MATKLRDMTIRRVSLVDAPASEDDVTKAGAFIELFKAADMQTCEKCGKQVVSKDGTCPECGAEMVAKAEWTTAQTNEFPDSSFAFIESGGTKDESGKTSPRSLRKLPFKDGSGAVDLPHLRNALARLSQTEGISAEDKNKIRARLESALAEANKACGPNDEAKKSAADSDAQTTAANPPISKEDSMSDELKAQVEKLQADLTAVTKERDEYKAKVDAVENSPEAIEKRKLENLPVDIRKQLDDQRETIQKMKDAADEREAIEKARKMDVIGTKPEALGPLMLRISKGKADEKDVAEVERLLKSLSAQASKARLFETLGSDGNDGDVTDDPQTILVNKAKALMKEDKGLDYPAAQAQVLKAEPELYERIRKGAPKGRRDDKD